MRLTDYRVLLATGVAGLVLLQALPAAAQSRSETELSPVVVNSGAGTGTEDTSGTGKVKGVVARKTTTGSKTATDITEIPQSVSVVGREEMDALGAQKADEALRYTAGVFTQPFGSDTDTNWMFIRGFQATADGVYLDGLQLYSYAFGGFYVDSFGLERVEVLKGPASVLYGGSNPGGVINYVSKRPTFERLRYAETGVNDAGTAYLGFDMGDTANNNTVAYRMTGKVAGGDGYTDYEDGWRGIISPSITWKPDEQTSFTVHANLTHIDENHNGDNFLPYDGTVVDRVVGGVNYGRIKPGTNLSEPDIDFYKRQQGSIGYEFEHTFDNDWTIRSNARFIGTKNQELSVYGNGWAPNLAPDQLSRINWEADTTAKSFAIDNQIEGKVETGPMEHTLLAGIEYKYYNIDNKQRYNLFNPDGNPIDPFDPVYGTPLLPRELQTNENLTLKSLGFYAQDQIRFGDGWLTTLNGRYDRAWLDLDNGPTFWGTSPDLSASYGEFSGRAGLAYEFENGLTPYASVATFFNPIVGKDGLTGELFKPETGTQYEVGLKYRPSFIDGLFTLSLFDLTRQNVPTYMSMFSQIQTGEVRSRGFEAEAKINVTEDFRVTGAVTAYDVDVTKAEAYSAATIGKTPTGVPEVQASLSADYTFRGDAWYDGVTIGGGLRYVGKSWADSINTLAVPAATLADLKLGYEKNNWGVDLNVTNLFDKTYVASCQSPTACYYGEGRSFKLKLHTTW
jgi:iron complex outermembrane receptor protein